jgi:hypothetical protein
MTLRWLPVGAASRNNETTLSVSSTSHVLLKELRDLGIVAALAIGGLVLEMPTYSDVHLENLHYKLPAYVQGKAVSEDEATALLQAEMPSDGSATVNDPDDAFGAQAGGLDHFFSLYQSVGLIIWKTETVGFSFDG